MHSCKQVYSVNGIFINLLNMCCQCIFLSSQYNTGRVLVFEKQDNIFWQNTPLKHSGYLKKSSTLTNILSYTAHCLVESRSLRITALCLQLDGTKCIPMKAEMFLDLHHKHATQGGLSLKSMIQAWGEPFQTNGINLLQAIKAHC